MDPSVNLRFIEPSAPSDRDQPVHHSWNQKSRLITLPPNKIQPITSNTDIKLDPRFDEIRSIENSIEMIENNFNSYK